MENNNAKAPRSFWQTSVCMLLFAGLLIVKCMVFQQLVFPDTEEENPIVFFSSMGTVLCIASLVYITRNIRWSWVFMLICDIWMIANLFYFRANGLFINLDAMKLADGLERAHSSLLTYQHWSMYAALLTTALYSVVLYVAIPRQGQRNWAAWGAALLVGTACLVPVYRDLWEKQMTGMDENIEFYLKNGNSDTVFGQDHTHGKHGWKLYLPFQEMRLYAIWSAPSDLYLRNRNILSYFPAIFVYEASQIRDSDIQAPTQEQLADALRQTTDTGDTLSCPPNLIVILVESWESWTLDSLFGEPLMPATARFVHEWPVYCHPRITSQVRHGVSGDGQMTLNTGLLPIVNGAACTRFPSNSYPNFAHYYPHSVVITPNNGWTQNIVTYSYGYKGQCVSLGAAWEDATIMDSLVRILDTIPQPFCVQAVTHTMHTPFKSAPDQHLDLPDDTPEYLRGYINSVRYTDNCLRTFYEYFQSSPLAKNTVVLMTGDHTIFKQMMLKEFQPFAEQHRLSFGNLKNYCPLLVYAPEFTSGQTATGIAYQMDIFPTLLPLIGADGYFWKGFGINLLDSSAVRKYTPEQAYQLSNGIICTDYFSQADRR